MTSTLTRPLVTTTADKIVRPTRTIAFACVAMFVSYLPFSAVNGALGTIGSAAHASTVDLQWVTDAFALALAATVLGAGALAGVVGRRRLTLAGLALTTLGSAVGLLAPTVGPASAIHLLWLAQGLAGLGGGAVMSATLGLIAAASPDETSRRRAIALWAAATTAGLGGGPFLPAVTSGASWSMFFAPILVLAIGAGTFGAMFSQEFATPSARLDVLGQVTSTFAVVAFGFAVIRGGSSGWTDRGTVVAWIVALVSVVAFAAAEHHAAAPLLRAQLFASRAFDAAGIATAATLFATVATVFSMSLLFAHNGATGLQIAVRLACLFAANVLASLASARLQVRFGPSVVLVAGLLVMAAGALTLATTPPGAGFADYAWRLGLAGVGSGMVMATGSAVAVSAAPAGLAGMAGAVNNAVRQLGAALGAAVIGSVLAARLASGASFPAAVHTCALVLAALLGLAATCCTVLLARRHA